MSKALAEVFFEAYVGNGNVRYYPRSEPVAVVTADDRQEYLSIRVDRRDMDGRPTETSHLEFLKANCLACIGEDIPEALLGSFGIHMATGGPRGRKRMVVNRYLETRQPNVYLVGDILSQAYFETDDFDADPADFREIKHRGNIKSALRDGVLVAQVIGQRLQGKTEIDVEIADSDVPEPEGAPVARAAGEREAEPPAASLEPARRPRQAAAFVIRLLPGGVEAEEHAIEPHGVCTLGRRGCDLSFPEDTLLEDRHASLSHTEDGTYLRDDGSSTGVFFQVPVHRKLALTDGDLLRAGRQFLLVGKDGEGFTLTHYDAAGREVGRHRLAQGTTIVGRQAPDVVLDPDDGTLSRRQLALTAADGTLLVKDLKTVNGTFLRVRSAVRLEHGDRFRLGGQRFVFSLREGAVLDAGHESAAPPPAATPSAPPPAAGADGPSVRFEGVDGVFAVAPGQTLCEVAEANGVKLSAECHSGICGSDPVRIVSGRENLESEAGDEEAETLEDLCGLEPGPCRLACMARVKGPVVVEVL